MSKIKQLIEQEFYSQEEHDYWVNMQNAIWIAEQEEFNNFKNKKK